MTCIECGEQMTEGPVSLHGEFRGLTLSVHMPNGWSCHACGYMTIHGKHTAEFGRKLREAYQSRKGLMLAEEVKSNRQELGLSQRNIAELLELGIATIKRAETRGVMSPAVNRLLKALFDHSSVEEVAWKGIEARMIEIRGDVDPSGWISVCRAFDDCSAAVDVARRIPADEPVHSTVWRALGEHVWNVAVTCSAISERNLPRRRTRVAYGEREGTKDGRQETVEGPIVA